MNRLQEIEQRMAAIQTDIEKEGADLDALETEINELREERKTLLESVERRKKLIESVTNDTEATVIDKQVESRGAERTFGADSKEYRNAFIKSLMKKENTFTENEQRAFVHTTQNTGSLVVPIEIADGIFSQLEEQHPLLNDVKFERNGTAIIVHKHTAIVAGDAAQTAEGVANADEENTFVEVQLNGKDFKKHVDVSVKMLNLAPARFEAYIINEIAERLGAAMAADVVAQVKADTPAGNKINAATPGTLVPADFLKLLSVIKASSGAVVYANSSTIYGAIAAMKNPDNSYTLIGDGKEDVAGRLLGKQVKEEDAIADGEVLILNPSKFYFNVVKDITIESDKDIKKQVVTIAGHSIAEGTLTNNKAAAVLTVGTATPTP